MIQVAVTYESTKPTFRKLLATVDLTEREGWAWRRAGTAWTLVVADEARELAAGALESSRPGVAAALRAATSDGVDLARQIRLDALTDRLRAVLPEVHADVWTDPLVEAAMLGTAWMAPGYLDATGAWSIREANADADDGEVVSAVLTGEDPAWGTAIPGCWYDRGKGMVLARAERAPAMMRALAPRSPSLAVSMARALLIDDVAQQEDTDWLAAAVDLDDVPPDLRGAVERMVGPLRFQGTLALRPYQQIGAVFAAASGMRCLVGDSPGVGKTATAIAAVRTNPARYLPLVVVAPASVLTSWHDELRRWWPGCRAVIVDGTTRIKAPGVNGATVWIVSWARLASRAHDFAKAGAQTIIMDEAHLSKHRSSLRARAAGALAKHMPYCLCLSGTPMENRATDLWHTLHMLAPTGYGDEADFRRRYGSVKRRTIGGRTLFDDRRDTMLPELRRELRGIMVRRLKTDVLKDLPDKVRTNLWIDLPAEAQAAYADAEAHVDSIMASGIRERRLALALEAVARGYGLAGATELANRAPMSDPAQLAALAIVVLGHMRRVVGKAKAAAAVEWILDFCRSGDSLIVFVEHHEVRDAVARVIHQRKLRWSVIDGDVSILERGARVRDFQAGRTQVLFCGLRSANTGITLTRASNVLFVERGLVPAAEEQAEDRAHRFGQKDSVNAYYLMAKGTVDERLHEIAEQKRKLTTTVLGSERVGEVDGDGADLGTSGSALTVAGIFASRVAAAIRGGADASVTEDDVRGALGGQVRARR